MFSNHRISTGGVNGRLMEAMMHGKRCELATKERQMKKIVRMLGGALVLLVMIIALVSCDDNVAPNDVSFDFTKTLPKTRSEAEAAIDSIEKDMKAIKDALDNAKKGTLAPYKEEFNDLIGDLPGLNPYMSGTESYWFGLYSDSSEINHYGITDAPVTSATGFFADKTKGAHSDITIVVDTKFKINAVMEGKPDIRGSYEISLNGSYVEDAGIIVPIASGTLKKTDVPTWSKSLTTADVLLDEGKYKWDKNKGENEDNYEPHQRILTVFMSLSLTSEKAAMKVFYTSAKDEGVKGEFVSGYTVHGEGGSWTSATWKKGDKQYTFLYSDTEDYDDVIIINEVAYTVVT